MKKFRLISDIEKEEQYLKHMSEKGNSLVKYSIFYIYTFKKAKPLPLNYKIDFRTFKNRQQYENYLSLFEDSGWAHMSGTLFSGNQIFLPKSNECQNTEIFSDEESKKNVYKKQLYSMWIPLFFIALLFCGILFFTIFQSTGRFSNLLDYHTWYLTSGLWDMSGTEFLRAFLLESIFVLPGILGIIFLPIMVIVSGYLLYKTCKLSLGNKKTK